MVIICNLKTKEAEKELNNQELQELNFEVNPKKSEELQKRGNLNEYIEREYFPQNPLNIDENYWYIYKNNDEWCVCIYHVFTSDTAMRCQETKNLHITLKLGKKRPLVGIVNNYKNFAYQGQIKENESLELYFYKKYRDIRNIIDGKKLVEYTEHMEYLEKGIVIPNNEILTRLFSKEVLTYFSVKSIHKRKIKEVKGYMNNNNNKSEFIMPISLIPYKKINFNKLRLQLDNNTFITYEEFYGGLCCCGHGNMFYICNDISIYNFFNKYQHKFV